MSLSSPPESVQNSLEAKFSGGKPGTIPIIPTNDFSSKMAVSLLSIHHDPLYVAVCLCVHAGS